MVSSHSSLKKDLFEILVVYCIRLEDARYQDWCPERHHHPVCPEHFVSLVYVGRGTGDMNCIV
jgi:hypothetical protein